MTIQVKTMSERNNQGWKLGMNICARKNNPLLGMGNFDYLKINNNFGYIKINLIIFRLLNKIKI